MPLVGKKHFAYTPEGMKKALAYADKVGKKVKVDKKGIGGMVKKYSQGGTLKGPSHKKGGIPAVIKGSGQPIEMEGGEYVIKKSSAKKLGPDILNYINKNGTVPKMAKGGPVPKMSLGGWFRRMTKTESPLEKKQRKMIESFPGLHKEMYESFPKDVKREFEKHEGKKKKRKGILAMFDAGGEVNPFLNIQAPSGAVGDSARLSMIERDANAQGLEQSQGQNYMSMFGRLKALGHQRKAAKTVQDYKKSLGPLGTSNKDIQGDINKKVAAAKVLKMSNGGQAPDPNQPPTPPQINPFKYQQQQQQRIQEMQQRSMMADEQGMVDQFGEGYQDNPYMQDVINKHSAMQSIQTITPEEERAIMAQASKRGRSGYSAVRSEKMKRGGMKRQYASQARQKAAQAEHEASSAQQGSGNISMLGRLKRLGHARQAQKAAGKLANPDVNPFG